ncbi:hypothetical protein NDU88_001524 [Pleurodeles waltl]|uniref:G protein-regulated inducer of neurite outgrowth C-terminal domain-containing protein n=1 Tax=Pleurodeles waltl TaxID=8319 RepID=A0AAV7W1A7_PLEWA|nr:hypothetical protein NDU88_001524 [Pleurodeles waltl]
MGTVPDPQESARTSVEDIIEEKDCLIDPHSKDHERKSEKNANGVPIPDSKPTPSGSFDLNCTSIETPMSQQTCDMSKHDLDQTVTPCPASPAEKEFQAVTGSISACGPLQQCILEEHVLSSDRTVGHLTDSQASTNTAMPNQQSNKPHPNSPPQADNSLANSCRTAINLSADTSLHKAESTRKDDEPHTSVSQSNVLQVGQTEKLSGKDTSIPDYPQSATSIGDCELNKHQAVNQLKGNCHTNLQTGPKDETDTVSCHISSISQESSPRTCTSDTQMSQHALQETPEPDIQTDSKYKNMGTMTHSCSSHDAEVQAVAHVESKSVSTSPSILAAYLRENQFQLKDREDKVCIIYRGNPRPGLPQHGNAFPMSLHKDMTRNPVITPKVRFRATAMEVLNPAYLRLHGRPGMSSDASCKISPNLTKVAYQGPDTSGYPAGMFKGESEAQAMNAARQSQGLPQHPLVAPTLHNVKPAYQINIEANNQNKQPQRPLEINAQPPQFMTGQEMNKRPSHHLLGVAESNQLRGNRAKDYEQSAADGDEERRPFHFKITNEMGNTQAIITTDIIKPKKEDKPAFLNFDGDITSNIGATGGQVEEFLQVFIKKEQDKLQEENEQAKRSNSLSLQSRAASDFSHTSSPHTPRLKKAREEKKEQRLAGSATPEQQGKLHLGKKQSSTKVEEKGKETKSVKDVVWDEQGMTWEVYGASMDPEALGIAIQNHLTRQIREHEKMIRAQMKQNRKSVSSDTSSKKLKGRQNNMFQSLFQNFRRPNCCVHPPSSAVLD